MNVRLPDGTIIENVPDGMTQSELMARVQAYQTPSQRRGENMDERMAKAPRIENPLGNVQRGAIDILGGGAQLLSRGANTLGLIPESTGGQFLAGPKEVEAQNQQARDNVDRWFGKSEGFSPVRTASGALLSMPLAPAKFLQAPTLIGRTAGAGISGGVSAAMNEIPNPESNSDFWVKKGIQTGAGTVAAGLAQPIAEKVVGQIVKGINTGADRAVAGARGLSGANSIDNIEQMAREALGRSGIDYDSLGEAAKRGLLTDVQKALSSYSGVNPGAVARQAAFREEGFDPLRHWVTRDPAEFTSLENLSHTDVGNPLKQRKADLDKHVLDRLNGIRGEQPDPTSAGQLAQQDLRGYLGQERGKTNVLYDTFKDIAPNVRGEPQRFVNDLFNGLEGQMALGSLPTGITNIVNRISKGDIPLTPSTLFQLQKMANAARGADGSSNYALGHLSRAIDREMEAISVPQGSQAADVLKMARGQHAKTQGALEDSSLLAAADEGKTAPEKFTDSLMGAEIKDVAKTWMKLEDDTKAQVRSQLIDDIKRMAFGGASDAAGKPAAQASINNFLSDTTNAAKLKIILGESGFQEVKRLGFMLESAHMQPAGSAVNNSKTGGALLTALPRIAEALKAKGIPGGAFAQDTARSGLVQSAQSLPAEMLGERSLLINPFLEEILRRRAGQGAGLLSGAGAYPLLPASQ